MQPLAIFKTRLTRTLYMTTKFVSALSTPPKKKKRKEELVKIVYLN
jgi:hypothetical protein